LTTPASDATDSLADIIGTGSHAPSRGVNFCNGRTKTPLTSHYQGDVNNALVKHSKQRPRLQT